MTFAFSFGFVEAFVEAFACETLRALALRLGSGCPSSMAEAWMGKSGRDVGCASAAELFRFGIVLNWLLCWEIA